MQAAIIVLLLAAALIGGMLIQSVPSDSVFAERAFFNSLNSEPGHRVQISPAEMVGSATKALAIADDAETKNSAYLSRAVAYHELHNYTLAIADLNAALSVNGLSRDARTMDLMYRGIFELEAHDAAGAEADFNQIAPLGGQDTWSAKLGRAQARFALGRYELALADYNDVIEALPGLYQREVERDFYGLPAEEKQKALAISKSSMKRNLASCYGLRANVYRVLGRYDKSIADYNAAIKLTPNRPSLYSGRARTEFAMGRWRAGFADFWTRTRLVFGWR